MEGETHKGHACNRSGRIRLLMVWCLDGLQPWVRHLEQLLALAAWTSMMARDKVLGFNRPTASLQQGTDGSILITTVEVSELNNPVFLWNVEQDAQSDIQRSPPVSNSDRHWTKYGV